MKKFISILLALMLVMSLGTVAFAAERDTTITKNYDKNGSSAVSPAETFSFTVEYVTATNKGTNFNEDNARANVPSIAPAVFAEGDAGKADSAKQLAISLPEYDDIGVYEYKVTENATNTAGVVAVNEFKLVVTVAYNKTNGKYETIAIHTESGEDAAKSSEITNTYSAGTLAITKEVTGAFGDRNQVFTVAVTFNAPDGKNVRSNVTFTDDAVAKSVEWNEAGTVGTATITLKHDETVTFNNIPAGVTYTVVETPAADYDPPVYNTEGGYAITEAEDDTLTITNNKGGTVDTGISLDSLPYILMLVVVGAAIVVVSTRKKGEQF